MRCDDARRQWRAGDAQEAAAHVAECATCFAVLEQDDPLVEVLRAARPEIRDLPSNIPHRVLQRWQPARLSWRLGIAAAAGLLGLATALAALMIWLMPKTIAGVLAVASNALDVVSTIVTGALAGPRVLVLDRPGVAAGYAVLVIIVCGLWVRLYQSIALQRRRLNR